MAYTLGQAAKATGKTKATIQEAIKRGRVSAAKDESGRYQIDPAELHRVYPPIPTTAPEPDVSDPLQTLKKDHEINRLSDRVKSLEEMLEQAKAEKEWAKEQADHWRLRVLALEAPKPAGQETGGIRGFFRRVFG